jgi:hypothetical protein
MSPAAACGLVELIEEAAGRTGNRAALPGAPELDCHKAIELR